MIKYLYNSVPDLNGRFSSSFKAVGSLAPLIVPNKEEESPIDALLTILKDYSEPLMLYDF